MNFSDFGKEEINVNYSDMSRLVSDTQYKKILLIEDKTRLVDKTDTGTRDVFGNTNTVKQKRHENKSICVADFCIISAVRKRYISNSDVYSDIVIIECENVNGIKGCIIIEAEKFDNRKIKSEIERQSNDYRFTSDISALRMNNLLFNYIRSILRSKDIEIPDKAGFCLDGESYKFVYHKNDAAYEADAVKKACYCTSLTDEMTYSNYECIKTLVSENALFNVLMVLDTASFMYTLLKNVKIDFNKLVVVTGCDTAEKKKILKKFFKVYDYAKNDRVSLSSKTSELRKAVFSRKDEAVLIEDDCCTKKTLMDNIGFLNDVIANRMTYDNNKAECNCIIMCNQSQTMEMLENYSENLLWIDASAICQFEEHLDTIIEFKDRIRETIIHFSTNKDEIENLLYNCNQKKSIGEDALSVSFMVIEGMCDSFLKLGINISSKADKVYNDLLEYINHSKLFYDNNYIVQQFIDCLNKEIENGRVAFGDNESEENLPVIYAKKELILIGVRDFAKFEQMIPFGIIDKTAKSNGVRLRNILSEEGCLVTNNGDKMLYKTSISLQSSERKNFVALKQSILSDAAKEKLPIIEDEEILSVGYSSPSDSDGVDRVLLGKTIDTDQPVYWSIGNVNLMNKHMFVQADSGAGKTTLLFLLAQRLYSKGKRVVIFDFAEKNSYSNSDIQRMDEGIVQATGRTVFENGITESDLFYFQESEFDTDIILSEVGVFVVRCSPVSAVNYLREVFNVLVEENKNRDKDVYVILDEINSLNFEEKFSAENDQTIADVVFRQGRSVGLNIISATQFLADKGSRKKAELFNQSAVRIALHMNTSSSTSVARTINQKEYLRYKEVLEKMTRGQALVICGIETSDGNIRNDLPLKIKIAPSDL